MNEVHVFETVFNRNEISRAKTGRKKCTKCIRKECTSLIFFVPFLSRLSPSSMWPPYPYMTKPLSKFNCLLQTRRKGKLKRGNSTRESKLSKFMQMMIISQPLTFYGKVNFAPFVIIFGNIHSYG